TRRSSVVDDLDLPPRRPRHPEVKLTRAEADLYERTTDYLRRLYREGFIQPAQEEEEGKPTRKGVVQLAVIHLRQRLCSSARAPTRRPSGTSAFAPSTTIRAAC